MDEERMSFPLLNDLPAWTILLGLAGYFIAGIGLGVLYFRSLWWNARRFTEDGRATTAIALMIGRFALLGILLTLASLEGALPLLAMALGILIARAAVMQSVRVATP
jgi:F1F0 ATPase subunit 2